MLSLWLNVPKLSDGARKEKSGEVGTASAKGLRQRESEEPAARKQALRGLGGVCKFCSHRVGRPLGEAVNSNFPWESPSNPV